MLPIADHALHADPACRSPLGLFGSLQRATSTAQLSLVTQNRSLCRVAEQERNTRSFLGLSAPAMGWDQPLGASPALLQCAKSQANAHHLLPAPLHRPQGSRRVQRSALFW